MSRALKRKSEKEKLLLKIAEKYRGYFSIHNRINSSQNRHVAVIQHALYENLLLEIDRDQEIREEIKVLFFLIISSGLRVSEALHLQRMAFETENGNLYFYTKVLKKRVFVERRNIVHPIIQARVSQYLLKFRAFDKIFSIDRHQALYQIKKVLGEALDLHALRHSHVSYLLFEKGFSAEEVSALLELGLETVKLYSHLDTTPLLNSLYSKKANSSAA